MEEKIYTMVEVQDQLRISRMQVWRLLQRGEFPHAFKIGGGKTSHWRFTASDIMKFKERHEVSTWNPE